MFCVLGCVLSLCPIHPLGRSERAKRRAASEAKVREERPAQPAEPAPEDGKKKAAPRARAREREAPPPAPEPQAPAPEDTPESGLKTLVGTSRGLFACDSLGNLTPLRPGGPVKKILRAGGDSWVIMGSDGIFFSEDLLEWERRDQGLPVKTLKIFQDGNKAFLPLVQEIKDLKINPSDSNIMACATKDGVYLSRDGGIAWTGLGAPPYRTNGIKAVASAYLPYLTVFLSHSTYGVYYIQPDRPGSKWTELNKGLETLETTGNADEVSDFAVIPGGEPGAIPEIFVSQTFRRRIYRLDWDQKTFAPVWSDESPFGTVDSLFPGKNGLYFLTEGAVASVDSAFSLQKRDDILEALRAVPAQDGLLCAALHENSGADDSDWVILSELWLFDEQPPGAGAGTARKQPFPQAAGREGLYLPVNHAMDSGSLKPYLDAIDKSGLNMIVIDMKDDYGRLRFTPENSAVSAKGRVFRPLDIEAFLAEMKERGIYTVARIVVFKDPELAGKENGRFAVWDAKNSKPWAGYYDTRRKKSEISAEDRRSDLMKFFAADDPDYEIVRTFYDERWVDPYSEEVWEYIALAAEELHERGFDEIQFDYIRFPTDGVNLSDARYRWQENGMDMESAILSFLRHVRLRVKAPISIDIYGANGWYRTGARTGQEVELLAPWVDVICPMYYPSHFEQHFLAQNPPELRPWRIYFQGTLRTARIARGQAVVRPYAQAFFLNVSYDRKYYNADYVRRQLEGVRDAGTGGLTYWNNSGRYEDLPAR